MRISRRTYPQPDSPMIGPRERALAVLKYVGGAEPEVTNPRHRTYDRRAAECFEDLRAMYESDVDPVDGATRAVHLAQPRGGTQLVDPTQHPLFACLVHSFEQAGRARRGELLRPSLIELRHS